MTLLKLVLAFKTLYQVVEILLYLVYIFFKYYSLILLTTNLHFVILSEPIKSQVDILAHLLQFLMHFKTKAENF